MTGCDIVGGAGGAASVIFLKPLPGSLGGPREEIRNAAGCTLRRFFLPGGVGAASTPPVIQSVWMRTSTAGKQIPDAESCRGGLPMHKEDPVRVSRLITWDALRQLRDSDGAVPEAGTRPTDPRILGKGCGGCQGARARGSSMVGAGLDASQGRTPCAMGLYWPVERDPSCKRKGDLPELRGCQVENTSENRLRRFQILIYVSST